MCAISINSFDWDSSESEGKRPKPTPLPHMRLWFSHPRPGEFLSKTQKMGILGSFSRSI